MTSRTSLPAFNDIGGSFALPKVGISVTITPMDCLPRPFVTQKWLLLDATNLYAAFGRLAVNDNVGTS